ncbi:MAG: MBL fold metallo-hydrolase [Nanobdellota archaeon]
MKTIQIADSVYKFKGKSNVYLLLEEAPILIDAGVLEEKQEILSHINEIIEPKKIKTILLTHLHYDHLGALDAFPEAMVHASRVAISDLYRDPQGAVLGKEEIDLLKGRDLYAAENMGSLKVIPSPGHTRGSVCYYHEDKNILFSGDTLFGKGIIGRVDLPTSNEHAIQGTIKVLNRYSDAILCPGHDY